MRKTILVVKSRVPPVVQMFALAPGLIHDIPGISSTGHFHSGARVFRKSG